MDKKVKVYLILSAIFCAILITGNLIFQKYISINLRNSMVFEVSVGVLLYPVTYIITDLITEFFGKSWARFTVKVSILCDLLIMSLIYLSNALPATSWSPVNDQLFSRVFSGYALASIGSLIACYISQTSDIIIYSYLKKLTGDRMLWVRCNVSTIIAQFIDTMCVSSILCFFNIIPIDRLWIVIFNSFAFKFIVSAVFSTPIFYSAYYAISKFIGKQSD